MRLTHTAADYRDKAEEVRTAAESGRSEEARNILLHIARQYEALAKLAGRSQS
jgi:hypothetical protein